MPYYLEHPVVIWQQEEEALVKDNKLKILKKSLTIKPLATSNNIWGGLIAKSVDCPHFFIVIVLSPDNLVDEVIC